MSSANLGKIINWILRIAVFGTFLGHGILAIGVKEGWIPYLQAVGFSEAYARTLMPIIGWFDVLVAVTVLFKPLRFVLVWAVIWAFATALIRPLSGADIWAFVERSANWAAPLALIFFQKFQSRVERL